MDQGEVPSPAALSRRFGVSRAPGTGVLGLLHLSSEKQKEVLETWPETPILPKPSFLDVDYRCSNGFLQRMSYTTMPYKTVIRLLVVARNPTNGFPARLLDKGEPVKGGVPAIHALLRESKVDGF